MASSTTESKCSLHWSYVSELIDMHVVPHSDERESTTKKIEELSNECSYLQSQLVEAQTSKEKVEEETRKLETKMTEEKKEHDAAVQQLGTEVASKLEDIQAKDKLIQKVRKLQ